MKCLRYLPLLLACILPVSFSAVAENSTTAGGFTVHYNALATAALTPEVAKAYGIQRSKNRGMLNVSMIKEQIGTTGTSVPGRVEVKTKVLTSQNVRLPMRELKDQDSVYYIGEFPIQNREKVKFAIEATPEGIGETFIVHMEHQFFTD